jgi:hypothetical protein
MKLKVVLQGPPCTKKNHGTIVSKRAILVPSDAYRTWHKAQLRSKQALKSAFRELIPIRTPVSIQATIYRVSNVGDWTGYLDAIADTLQMETWKCENPAKKLDGKKSVKMCGKVFVGRSPGACPICKWPEMKRKRDGLGIILDDKLIAHWDRTRLKVDAKNPRVELLIESPPRRCAEVDDEEQGMLPGAQAFDELAERQT